MANENEVLQMKPKTALVIDAGLIWNYIDQNGEKVDQSHAIRTLLGNLQQRRAYKFQHMHYVDAEPPAENEMARAVFDARMKSVMQLGISTSKARMKEIKYWSKGCESSKRIQADADARIVTKIMSLVAQNELEELCLVTGDGDFEECLNYIKNTSHKKVTLVSFKVSLSPLIQQHAHEWWFLDDWWEQLKHHQVEERGTSTKDMNNDCAEDELGAVVNHREKRCLYTRFMKSRGTLKYCYWMRSPIH
ncbi:hypothetical protein CYMTET_56942 [Cymbomonas tetramitiformis]|uniref:NYN domain-containing protein n=1 Tax=Cymbomonas tetramitiformis TaxID=36881 RepID=A0AAE0BB75_9CHLO|nr:hypothetical protein CYMTET_56942 [Cymbomonas tetramitiformis]|eukprot:gene748-1216_t